MDLEKFIKMCIEMAQEKSIIMDQEDKDYLKKAVEKLAEV